MAAAKKSSRSSKRSSKKSTAKRSTSKTPSAARKPAASKSSARSAPKKAPVARRAAPRPEPQRSPQIARPIEESSIPVTRQFETSGPARQPIRNDREPWKPVFTIRPCFIIALRILLGFLFLWAFLDKLFGFGYSTKAASAWIHGGSPTEGFLLHSTQGFLAPFYQSIAHSPIIAWLFMLGLLAVGMSFVFGTKVRLASYAGALMLVLMYLAEATWVPGSTNPLVDYHIVYAVAMLAVGHARYSVSWDFVRNWWVNVPMVKRRPWLA